VMDDGVKKHYCKILSNTYILIKINPELRV